jgi:hypothetical protein
MIMTRQTEWRYSANTMFEQYRELQEYRASEELRKAVQRVVAAIIAGKVTMEDIQSAIHVAQAATTLCRRVL